MLEQQSAVIYGQYADDHITRIFNRFSWSCYEYYCLWTIEEKDTVISIKSFLLRTIVQEI